MRAILTFSIVFATGCANLVGIGDLTIGGDGGTSDAAVDGSLACTPSQNYCDGDKVYACYANGTRGELLAECALGLCRAGACIDSCAAAEAAHAYIGCEYWAADLPNVVELFGPAADCNTILVGATHYTGEACWDGTATQGLCPPDRQCTAGTCQAVPASANICAIDAQHARFGLVVANPSPTLSAEVTLQDGTGMSVVRTVGAESSITLFPQELGFADHSLAVARQMPDAYRISSSRPVTAYQFNPLVANGAFSADASLLYPAHNLGNHYVIDAPPSGAPGFRAFATLIGVGPGTTTVAITPSVPTIAGVGVTAHGAGQAFTATLAPYDALTLAADGDLSGTVIETPGTVAVFAGNDLAFVRGVRTDTCCGDHLEEQVLPPALLDRTYAIAVAPPLMGAVDPGDRLHLVSETGATVTIDPPPAAGSCANLAAHVACDVRITADTLITASAPITVAHLLMAHTDPSNPTMTPGDPSMTWAIPTSRYRPTMLVDVPTGFTGQWLLITAPPDVTARVDGSAVPMTTIGGSTYQAARAVMTPGRHAVDCRPGVCGVTMMGVAPYVSYIMPAGLDAPL